MTQKEKILLFGGGGHCKACIDVIEAEGRFDIRGIIDVKEKVGNRILGYNIIGTDDDISDLTEKISNAFITVGHIKTPKTRKKLYNLIIESNIKLPVIISPYAYVSKHSVIGKGTIVMHGSVVNADVTIGDNCIINNLALIEHDVNIGNFVHISTGARINGSCKIGNDCFIGSGTILNQNTSICDNVIIGSGSLVRKDITEPGIYVGNPLRKIK